jgi:hypothetical protein
MAHLLFAFKQVRYLLNGAESATAPRVLPDPLPLVGSVHGLQPFGSLSGHIARHGLFSGFPIEMFLRSAGI